MKRLFLIAPLLLLSCLTIAQTDKQGKHILGVETQFYPAGFIVNAKIGWNVSNTGQIIGKIGYNIAQRQNFGKHDKEEGGGVGFTFAYKSHFHPSRLGWFIEARAGMWFLDIDWQNNSPLAQGNTDISVFQPTAGIGYDFRLNHALKIGAIVAFGYEFNMVTNGEKVGEGGISLAGVSFAYIF